MHVNHEYTFEHASDAPPVDEGEALATFRRGRRQELRVSLAEWHGHPFVDLKVWRRESAGPWRPVKGRSCSVRLAEAGPLAEALARVGAGRSETERPAARQRPRCDARGRPGQAGQAAESGDRGITPPWE